MFLVSGKWIHVLASNSSVSKWLRYLGIIVSSSVLSFLFI